MAGEYAAFGEIAHNLLGEEWVTGDPQHNL